MGDVRGFMKVRRKEESYRPVCERLNDFSEVAVPLPPEDAGTQASRCMDCGTPFCHWGCPIGNHIPEWNDSAFRNDWYAALRMLSETNNFPEITGRVCPASCEYSCVLGINDDPVTIRQNELAIIEKAFTDNIVKPFIPANRTGKKTVIVGSGPAGLACADQLNRAGHNVTVYEKDDSPGGLLRYGIPEFKLEKRVLDRRIEIMKSSGIGFVTGLEVGKDISFDRLKKENDAICIATGSGHPRDIKIEGRGLGGIYFAMDYLRQGNIVAAGRDIPSGEQISAEGKKVVVIGGGDTGSDCVGTANRQEADCVVQIELLPRPGECRSQDQPWPKYPFLMKTSSSHEEGVTREWSVLTKRFYGEKGKVRGLECVRVEFIPGNGKSCPVIKEIENSGFNLEADLVIIAAGFLHPEIDGVISESGVELSDRNNVKTDRNMKTSLQKVFSAGDCRRGQSLVVWAISEGRRCAHNIDKHLMGKSFLPLM